MNSSAYPRECCTAKNHLSLGNVLSWQRPLLRTGHLFGSAEPRQVTSYSCVITADFQNRAYSILLHVLPNAHSYCALLPEEFLEEGYCYNRWLHCQLTGQKNSSAELKISEGNVQLAPSHLLYMTLQNKPSGFDNQVFFSSTSCQNMLTANRKEEEQNELTIHFRPRPGFCKVLQ